MKSDRHAESQFVRCWARLHVMLLLATLASVSYAQRPENDQAAALHVAFAPGAASESAAATMAATIGQPAADHGDAGSAALFTGLHAPPVDALGPITRQRIIDFLLGANTQLDTMAADAAGNHDANVDVADLVWWVLRQLF